MAILAPPAAGPGAALPMVAGPGGAAPRRKIVLHLSLFEAAEPEPAAAACAAACAALGLSATATSTSSAVENGGVWGVEPGVAIELHGSTKDDVCGRLWPALQERFPGLECCHVRELGRGFSGCIYDWMAPSRCPAIERLRAAEHPDPVPEEPPCGPGPEGAGAAPAPPCCPAACLCSARPFEPPDGSSCGVSDAAEPGTAARRGLAGESRVGDLLARAGFEVRPLAHRARSADMAVTTEAGEVLIETKNYSSTVPQKEIDKFRRDLGARGAEAGVMVSVAGRFAGVRGELSARIENLPGAGRAVPLVYAGRAEFAPAAVELAVHLAKQRARPGVLGAAEPPPGDARLEELVPAFDEVAELVEAAKAELVKAGAELSGRLASSAHQLGFALHDHRRLCRALRATSGPTVSGEPDAVLREFDERYRFPEDSRQGLAAAVSRLSDTALGDVRRVSRWRFAKSRATHLSTGTAFSFSLGRVEISLDLTSLTPGRAAELLGLHPGKVRVADGRFGLVLDSETAETAGSFF